jgi:hypothetical protein
LGFLVKRRPNFILQKMREKKLIKRNKPKEKEKKLIK